MFFRDRYMYQDLLAHASSKEALETSEWCVCRRLQGEMSRAFNAGIEICSDCGPEHGRPVLDLTQGDCICARCGLVLCQKLIDESSEARNFADDDTTKLESHSLGLEYIFQHVAFT